MCSAKFTDVIRTNKSPYQISSGNFNIRKLPMKSVDNDIWAIDQLNLLFPMKTERATDRRSDCTHASQNITFHAPLVHNELALHPVHTARAEKSLRRQKIDRRYRDDPLKVVQQRKISQNFHKTIRGGPSHLDPQATSDMITTPKTSFNLFQSFTQHSKFHKAHYCQTPRPLSSQRQCS